MNNSFEKLVEVMKILRGPNGCPWDKEQTLETLKKSLIEECYEVIEVMNEENGEELKKELGDLLFLIIFQAEIMSERDKFDIYNVAESAREKLIRRHPHIFGSVKVEDSNEVVRNWEEIKKKEKGHEDRESILDGIPKAMPPLEKAFKIQNKVIKKGFELESIEDAFEKVEEEIEELKIAVKNNNKINIKEEVGDIIFSLINISCMLDVEPSSALADANKKFEKRFRYVEKNYDISKVTLREIDKIWNQAKYVYKEK